MPAKTDREIAAEMRDVVATDDREKIAKAIKSAARAKAASRETSLSRDQIELAAALNAVLPEETRARLAKEHLGDDRDQHVAMMTSKAGATTYLHALLAALPEPAREETPAAPTPRPAGYTDEQLAKGKAAREAGGSWTKVAEAAGVKPENYFSRVLRERFPELAAPVKKPAPAKDKPAAKKPARRAAKATAKK